MANLRANRITSTEVFETTGSVQFDGSGDYLSLSSNDGFDFGSGSFTIEAWVYPKTLTSDILFATSNTTGGFFFGRRNSGSYIGYGRLATAWDNSSGNDLIINQWNHVAVCRESNNNIRVFLNGIQSGPTKSLSTSYNLNTLTIGGTTSDYYVNGHISNLRVLKGTALYTKNFTPPTRELEVIPNTVLLCAQSKTQANREATGKTITVNGNAVASELTPGLLTNVVKSGGNSAITGSVEFDGTGDYLQVSANNDLSLTGDFTIEYWVYMSNTESNMRQISSGNYYTAGKNGNWYFGINNSPTSSDHLVFASYDGQSNFESVQLAATPGLNAWHHIAATRVGSTVTLFVNGISIGSGTISKSLVDGADGGLQIGRLTTYGDHYGFISNLRIIKGQALYKGNFIPPTRKLTRVPGTVLLCCTDSSNPLKEETGKTITPYGSLDRQNIGVELVTNGTFDTSTTGWTAWLNSSISVSSGNLRIDSTFTYAYVYTSFSTKPGSEYRVSLEFTQGTSTFGYFRIGTSIDNDSLATVLLTTTKKYEALIRATSSTTYITLVMAGGSGTYSLFDNVSAYKIDPGPKQPFVPQIGTDGTVVFDGVTKINTPNYFYLPTGSTEQRGRGRGVFGGGSIPGTIYNVIDYIQIQSTGNAIDFGDLTQTRQVLNSCSSTSRGLFGGGQAPTNVNTIDYITIAVTGNAVDFGDLSATKDGAGSCSSSTRGVFAGGRTPTIVNTIEYVTISSLGNSISFGILSTTIGVMSGCSSPIRGVFAGGVTPTIINNIEYITIASTGNSQDFGDLTQTRQGIGAVSSLIRGVFAGGASPADSNVIDYITIASTGNAIDFGDLTSARTELGNGASNSVRGVFGGGLISPVSLNNLDYITISSTGNSQDFGDLTTARRAVPSGCSDSHGGLG